MRSVEPYAHGTSALISGPRTTTRRSARSSWISPRAPTCYGQAGHAILKSCAAWRGIRRADLRLSVSGDTRADGRPGNGCSTRQSVRESLMAFKRAGATPHSHNYFAPSRPVGLESAYVHDQSCWRGCLSLWWLRSSVDSRGLRPWRRSACCRWQPSVMRGTMFAELVVLAVVLLQLLLPCDILPRANRSSGVTTVFRWQARGRQS